MFHPMGEFRNKPEGFLTIANSASSMEQELVGTELPGLGTGGDYGDWVRYRYFDIMATELNMTPRSRNGRRIIVVNRWSAYPSICHP